MPIATRSQPRRKRVESLGHVGRIGKAKRISDEVVMSLSVFTARGTAGGRSVRRRPPGRVEVGSRPVPRYATSVCVEYRPMTIAIPSRTSSLSVFPVVALIALSFS